MIELKFTLAQGNWLEVSWTDVIKLPDVVHPAQLAVYEMVPDEYGELQPGELLQEAAPETVTPGEIQRTQLKYTCYHPTQLDLLQADAAEMGTPLDDHMLMLRAWVESYVPEAPNIESMKSSKNAEINASRLAANRSSFTHMGKSFACDELSRSDIDGVTSFVSLSGSLPPGWPGAWKAIDNTYLPITSVDDWKAFVASMVAAGNANFAKAQSLKTQLAAASTHDEIAAIKW